MVSAVSSRSSLTPTFWWTRYSTTFTMERAVRRGCRYHALVGKNQAPHSRLRLAVLGA